MGHAQGNPFPLPSRLPAGQGLLEPEPLEVSKCDRSRGAEWVWASAAVTAAGNSIKARSSRHLRAPRMRPALRPLGQKLTEPLDPSSSAR